MKFYIIFGYPANIFLKGNDIMSENTKEYADWLRKSIRDFVDGIDESTEKGTQILYLVYGFARAGFLENKAEKGGAK